MRKVRDNDERKSDSGRDSGCVVKEGIPAQLRRVPEQQDARQGHGHLPIVDPVDLQDHLVRGRRVDADAALLKRVYPQVLGLHHYPEGVAGDPGAILEGLDHLAGAIAHVEVKVVRADGHAEKRRRPERSQGRVPTYK